MICLIEFYSVCFDMDFVPGPFALKFVDIAGLDAPGSG
jgi:hypothetical protein